MDDRDAAETAPPPDAAITPPPETSTVKATPRRQSPPGGVKETLESILVAFILAFIFRAFVVEAFVIPTGSMAPTLLGAHMRYTCPDCGYHFDADYRPPGAGDDTDIPDRAGPIITPNRRDPQHPILQAVVYQVRCPNCGLNLPDDENPRVYYGDRILVLKYMYLLQKPQRWDVVVFKSPYDIDKGKPEKADPALWKYNYAVNYIKRLVGRPGEWLMILDGDVYVGESENGPWGVQPKPRGAQEALWRIVYDNDFHPLNQAIWVTHGRGDAPWTQPWRQTDGDVTWDTGEIAGQPVTRRLTFKGIGGSGVLEFDPSRNRPPATPAYQDWLAYDQTVGQSQPSSTVRDLKLQLDYSRTAGDGPLRLKLEKYDDTFLAEFGTDSVKLTHQTRDGKRLGEKSAALPKPVKGSRHIEFSNVDYRVTVRVNDQDLIQTTAEEYHPDLEFLRLWDERGRNPLPPPVVGISASHQDCALEHVSLWRDIYYTSVFGSHTQGGPRNPAHLGPNEYFVCGDNSAMSLDSRLWPDPIDLPDEALKAEPGRVPGRFMLGKAFFVYWPAGYRPVDRLPGLIPNFGEMRFIR